MAFSKHGKYWYKEDSWQDYLQVPWGTISDSSRRKVMKHLIPKPDRCPNCGALGRVEDSDGWWSGPRERVLILCNRSGFLLQDLSDWYWTCRDCHSKAYKKEHRNPPHIHLTK